MEGNLPHLESHEFSLDRKGRLRFRRSSGTARLSIAVWDADAWVPVPLVEEAGAWTARCLGGKIRLALTPCSYGWDYALVLEGASPTRVRLQWELAPGVRSYHLMPGVCHGDNSLDHDPDGRYPHLAEHGPSPAVSPVWEFRADRCSYPLSLMMLPDAIYGVSIDPYAEGYEAGTTCAEIPNGVAACIAGENRLAACAVTLGYRNLPATYICQRSFGPPTGRLVVSGKTTGRIYAVPISSRTDVHAVIRSEYGRLDRFRRRRNGEPPAGWDDEARAVEALRWGLSIAAWDETRGVIGNPNWDHASARFVHSEAFGFLEVAWTAGAPVAFPLLVSGLASGDRAAVTRARMTLDRIASGVNPESGFLHDAVDSEGRPAEGWWSHFKLVPFEHYAYLNGQAAFYLLRAYEADLRAPGREAWRRSAIRVLHSARRLQKSDGTLPWCVSRQTGAALDYDGFGSCWFVPALAAAYRLSGDRKLLDSAVRSFERYGRDVARGHCSGTPLDTAKAVDQEGVLSYIKAARLLYEITRDDSYLRCLRLGLEYELLWRYGYNTRPPAARRGIATLGAQQPRDDARVFRVRFLRHAQRTRMPQRRPGDRAASGRPSLGVLVYAPRVGYGRHPRRAVGTIGAADAGRLDALGGGPCG